MSERLAMHGRILLSPEGTGGSSPQDGSGGGFEVESGGLERRQSSVQLRATTPGASGASGSDTANQSIADALKISFFLLKLGMLALGVLYALSGFQFVKEGEQGIRLLFGRVQDASVEPGFRYSWPFPFGEMVRVETGANDLAVEDVFWVEIDAGQDRNTSVDRLGAKTSLKPRDDAGSLLTSDGNIAHARVRTVYRRADPGKYAQHIYPGIETWREEERKIVRLAIQRGVVHAVARVSIDDLLKQTASDEGAVASVAKRGAQEVLDELESGIVLDTLSLEPIAPLFVREDFAKVQAAVANAARAVEEARLEAQRSLNGAAGAAAPVLGALIDAYDGAITRKDEAAQRTALAAIDAALDAGKVTIPGAEGAPGQAVVISGEAARLLNNATQYRTAVVARRRGQLDAFNAKLAQYEANPSVMVQREWTGALSDFYSRDNVEIFMMYPGLDTLAIQLNRDPEIARAQERLIKSRETQQSVEARNREWQNRRYETDVAPKMVR